MKFDRTYLLAAPVALIGLVTACGGSTTTDTAQPDFQTASTDYATAICTAFSTCESFSLKVDFGDIAGCTTALTPSEQVATLPGSGVTPANLEACARAMGASGCNNTAVPAVCDFHGTVATGEACVASLQCVAGDYCTGEFAGACGTCAPEATLGEPCAGAACAPSLECSFGSAADGGTTSQCVPLQAEGSACDASHFCAGSLMCSSGGTCIAPLELGADCAAAGGYCDSSQGLYCGTSGTCVSQPLAPIGGSCGFVNGVQVACTGLGVVCGIASTSPVGTCLAPLKDGQTCGGAVQAECAPPSFCLNGTCTQDLPVCH